MVSRGLALHFTLIMLSVLVFQVESHLGWALGIFAFCVNGFLLYQLNNMQHELCHFGASSTIEQLIESLVFEYPLLMTSAYRRVHLDHHRHFGTDKDPDLWKYKEFPSSRLAFLRRFLFMFSGASALQGFLVRNRQQKLSKLNKFERLFGPAISLTVLWTVFWITTGNLGAFLLFYILPLATISKGLADLRTFLEHASQDGPVLRNHLRLTIFDDCIGSYGFSEHGNHHSFPKFRYQELEAGQGGPEGRNHRHRWDEDTVSYLSRLRGLINGNAFR